MDMIEDEQYEDAVASRAAGQWLNIRREIIGVAMVNSLG